MFGIALALEMVGMNLQSYFMTSKRCIPVQSLSTMVVFVQSCQGHRSLINVGQRLRLREVFLAMAFLVVNLLVKIDPFCISTTRKS